MRFGPGTRFGPYEILERIGEGGMGEVYRARDNRLNRTVAIKVLNQDRARDASFRHRFHDEARTISSLDHANICSLYDVGHEGGADFLVMQFLDGETLSARLKRGPLPLRQALKVAAEVAAALECAHRKGVVHRDLKPANVMLTKAGAKLLDFGIATMTMGQSGGSTTVTLPWTGRRSFEGTPQYMAPEQVRGLEGDARSDIFAFGAVLHEMLTGLRAFPGPTPTAQMDAILTAEPPLVSTIQPRCPRALDHLVRRCLAKDPDERWQVAHDVKAEIEWIASDEALVDGAAATGRTDRRREWLAWALAAAAVVAAGVVGTRHLTEAEPSQPLVRFDLPPPSGAAYYALQLEVSPDGTHLALPLLAGQQPTLWVRALDTPDMRELPGTEGVDHPFWSPDSRRLAFFADGRLMVIDAAGGPPTTLADASAGGGSWWGDTIVFGQPPRGIFRVAASGGVPAAVTTVDATAGEQGHAWPSFLPDGRQFLYFASHAVPEQRGIYLGSLDGQAPVLVQRSQSMGVYAAGFLLFVRDGVLLARRFDPENPTQSAPTQRLADAVGTHPSNGRAAFGVSRAGVLAYRASETPERRRLVWHAADGRSLGEVGNLPAAAYQSVALSPDGRHAVVTRRSPRGDGDVVLVDLQRGVATPAASDKGDETMPVWAPDGAAIIFSSNREGRFALFRTAMPGGGPETQAATLTGDRLAASDWTPDGKALIAEYRAAAGPEDSDLWLVPASGEGGEPRLLVGGPQNQRDARLSPDGRWLAYTSAETGRSEVYVQPFPPTGSKWIASTNGGAEPHWTPRGDALYYLGSGGELLRVEVRVSPAGFDTASPTMLDARAPATVGMHENRFDLSRDGRILMLTTVEERDPPPVTVVLNWVAQLPR